jgi:hypothetical protein
MTAANAAFTVDNGGRFPTFCAVVSAPSDGDHLFRLKTTSDSN